MTDEIVMDTAMKIIATAIDDAQQGDSSARTAAKILIRLAKHNPPIVFVTEGEAE